MAKKNTNTKQRYSKEEIVKYKVDRAQRPDTTVMTRPQSAIGDSLYRIAPQIDRCMAQLLLQSGQIGGVSSDKVQEYISELNTILLDLDSLAQKVSKETRYTYRSPRGFNEMRKAVEKLSAESEEDKSKPALAAVNQN